MGLKSKIKNVVKSYYKVKNEKNVISVPIVKSTDQILDGKVAFITGGSGGIGFGIAKRFTESGGKVILAGTNEEKLKDNITKLSAGTATYVIFDARKVASFYDVIIEAEKKINATINVFVNSAGVHGNKQFLDVDEETYDAVLDVNTKATYFMCQAAGKYMIQNDVKGHILNVSSAAALKPAWTPYEVSKWGVRGMTLGIADELLPYGVVVNAIGPGPVATSMLGRREEDTLYTEYTPSHRLATPEEIGQLAVIMVSDMCNLVIGDTFYISGGSGTVKFRSEDMDKVLMLGGTGAIGSGIAKNLEGGVFKILITSRSNHHSYKNIEYIKLNALDYDALTSFLAEKQFLAIFDFMLYQTSEQFSKFVQLLMDHTLQYFFFSSSRVYTCSDEALTEESPRILETCTDQKYLKANEYSIIKAKEEDIIRSSNRTNYTIVRPYITYNAERLQLGACEKENWLYRALHDRTIVFFRDLQQTTTSLTYAADTSKILSGLIGRKEALGETFQIASNEHETWDDVLNSYLRVLSYRTGYKKKPLLLKDSLILAEVEGNRWQVLYDRKYNRKFNSSKVLELDKEFDSFTPYNTGLEYCLNQFIDAWKREGDSIFKNINWKVQGYLDKLTSEFITDNELDNLCSKDRKKYYLYHFAPYDAIKCLNVVHSYF